MFGLNINPTYPGGTPSLEELKSLGVQILRYTYYDASGGDQLDPARAQHYTQKVKEYHQAGMGSLLILTYDTYPNKPNHDASDQDWDNYIDRFVRRAGQIARMLAEWQPAYQIWNEPDHPPSGAYTPTLREAVFGRMLRRAYQAIKEAAPEAQVIAGGLASGDAGWLTRVINSLGGELPADIIAFHPYGQRPDRNWPHSRWFFNEGSYVGNLLNNYYKTGQNKPVWITEMGIKHEDLEHDQNKMADFLRRYYKAMTSRYQDKVQRLFWFCYSDNMVEPFGLLDRNMQPKPIYQAFREAAAEYRPEPVDTGVPAPPPPAVGVPTPVETPVTTPVTAGEQPLLPDLSALLDQTTALQKELEQFQVHMAQLEKQVQQLSDQQARLLERLEQGTTPPTTPAGSQPGISPGVTPQPPIQNIITSLKRHSSLPYYGSRPLSQIKRVIIHHTAIAPSIGAERIAAYRVDRQNQPGIGYHYFITADGRIQQTNELTTQSTHAGSYDPVAVGVCFAGDFTQAVPTPAQLDAGARLIAWLLSHLGLNLQAVSGYKELAQTQSPGAQWDSGHRWGAQLRQRIQAHL